MNWNVLQNDLLNGSFALLLIALLTYWSSIAFPQFKWLQKVSRIEIIIINLTLALTLLSRWMLYGYFPLSNLYESLLFLTWCLTFVQILLEKQTNSQIIGSISIPIGLFTIAFASISLPQEMQQASPLVPALRSNWLMMHVTIMMLSYAFLIIGSLLSILFLIITRGQSIALKGNSTGYIFAKKQDINTIHINCLLYTSPSPRDKRQSRMPSSA